MSKIEQFSDRCRCCLKTGHLKDMWSVFTHDGQQEIYGELLTECFAISLQPSECKDHICTACIKRLRDAYKFRILILASEEHLFNDVKQEIVPSIRVKNVSSLKFKEDIKEEVEEVSKEIECTEENVQYLFCDEVANQEQGLETVEDEEYIEESTSMQLDDDSDEDVEYLEVEFLDEGDNATEAKQEPQTKRKWPKKKKKHEKLTTYKKYPQQDLRKAMEAVKNDLMTRSEAAAYYKVPLKTLGAKIRAEESEIENPDSSNEKEDVKENQVKQLQFLEEIKTMLTYTNGTPFKTKSSRYYCAYCSTEGPCFEDPEELRAHTRTKHINDRLNGVELFMRPSYLNEVLKFDIENLICSICCVAVEAWNDIFSHLVETHEVELEMAYNKIIPFKLTEELFCALCNEKYPSFTILDAHMNAHYSNYICGECGDTFLSESRMKKHTETHRTGKFACPHCDKVFALEKYRKKHIDGVHVDRVKFKCRHCPENFRLEHARHLHEVKEHDVKVKLISCNICDKVFDYKSYYIKHMRLRHGNLEKKYKCEHCDKVYRMPYELKNHDLACHKGVFICKICGKKFSSKQYLSKHHKTHVGDVVSISYK